jgi:hypothetical protein
MLGEIMDFSLAVVQVLQETVDKIELASQNSIGWLNESGLI